MIHQVQATIHHHQPLLVDPHHPHRLVLPSNFTFAEPQLPNSAPAPINLGLTNAQKTCLFEMELEKSEHQIRQAAAAADQAERLQQVAEENARLEIEYMRKEGDARLAALNARREPATQGAHERVRNEEDDDSLGKTTPPRGCCPSRYVFRPAGRRDCQNF